MNKLIPINGPAVISPPAKRARYRAKTNLRIIGVSQSETIGRANVNFCGSRARIVILCDTNKKTGRPTKPVRKYLENGGIEWKELHAGYCEIVGPAESIAKMTFAGFAPDWFRGWEFCLNVRPPGISGGNRGGKPLTAEQSVKLGAALANPCARSVSRSVPQLLRPLPAIVAKRTAELRRQGNIAAGPLTNPYKTAEYRLPTIVAELSNRIAYLETLGNHYENTLTEMAEWNTSDETPVRVRYKWGKTLQSKLNKLMNEQTTVQNKIMKISEQIMTISEMADADSLTFELITLSALAESLVHLTEYDTTRDESDNGIYAANTVNVARY